MLQLIGLVDYKNNTLASPIETFSLTLQEKHLFVVLRGYAQEGKVRASLPEAGENITTHQEGFLFVFTYLFTLGFKTTIIPVIKDFCKPFNVCWGQLGPNVWPLMDFLRFLAEKVISVTRTEGFPCPRWVGFSYLVLGLLI